MADLILDAMMVGCPGIAATNCVVVNGDFETGDLTGWTCLAVVGGCSVLDEAGNSYVRLTLQ